MSTLRAVVVDDEPLARDELAFLLRECGDVDVVGQAGSASEAIEVCASSEPDVVFLDVRMPGPDGLALGAALRAKYADLPLVIVSAHDDAALRAFDLEVLDYLLKPVRADRLRRALDRVRGARRLPSGTPFGRLAVRRRGVYVVLDIADVVFFEMRDELVWAVTADDRFALDLSLAAVESRLDQQRFFRSHRGNIVRLDKVLAIEPTGAGTYELVLDHPDKPRIPLARERARLLRELIPFAG